ncbi:hypothetical protein C8R43DRAFT_564062 [Mycena crocata]|nr:hypothetical protein C8R43DRAFT_564062 [Mycena crocata]
MLQTFMVKNRPKKHEGSPCAESESSSIYFFNVHLVDYRRSEIVSPGPTAREHEDVAILPRDLFSHKFGDAKSPQPFTALPGPLIHPRRNRFPHGRVLRLDCGLLTTSRNTSAGTSRSKRRLRHGASTLGAYSKALARKGRPLDCKRLAWFTFGSSEANPLRSGSAGSHVVSFSTAQFEKHQHERETTMNERLACESCRRGYLWAWSTWPSFAAGLWPAYYIAQHFYGNQSFMSAS